MHRDCVSFLHRVDAKLPGSSRKTFRNASGSFRPDVVLNLSKVA